MNTMETNILFNKDAYAQLKEGVNLICDAVKVTLGPRGKNVLTINSYGEAHLTKDGITVAKNVTSKDPIINGIINVVREASANTAKTAGDGTTTSLVLTQALFNEGLKLIESGANPTFLKEGMNEALNDTLNYIETLSEKITIKDVERLKSIATISAAMDESVATTALTAVLEAKGTGVIRIDESKTPNTTIKTDRGLTFANGYLTSHFLNSDKPVIEYDNPYIFVSNIELNNATLVTLMKHAKNNSRPLIVLAPEFNENITISMFKNFKSGAVQVCPIKLPGFAANRHQWIDDITAYTDGELYTSNNIDPIKYLGDAEKIIISQDETSIVNTDTKLSCSSQLCKLEAKLSEDLEDWQKEDINNRLARLRGLVVTIFVGATTELELKEKKDRVEDAVCALQTALKGGISEGGGMTFARASNELYDTAVKVTDKVKGYNLVIDSLLSPFVQLCENSDLNSTEMFNDWNWDAEVGYNFKTLQFENLKESGVIDPTLVLKNAITNAVGIVSNLLMTECITYHE
jgi:chaperonin GroEL